MHTQLSGSSPKDPQDASSETVLDTDDKIADNSYRIDGGDIATQQLTIVTVAVTDFELRWVHALAEHSKLPVLCVYCLPQDSTDDHRFTKQDGNALFINWDKLRRQQHKSDLNTLDKQCPLHWMTAAALQRVKTPLFLWMEPTGFIPPIHATSLDATLASDAVAVLQEDAAQLLVLPVFEISPSTTYQLNAKHGSNYHPLLADPELRSLLANPKGNIPTIGGLQTGDDATRRKLQLWWYSKADQRHATAMAMALENSGWQHHRRTIGGLPKTYSMKQERSEIPELFWFVAHTDTMIGPFTEILNELYQRHRHEISWQHYEPRSQLLSVLLGRPDTDPDAEALFTRYAGMFKASLLMSGHSIVAIHPARNADVSLITHLSIERKDAFSEAAARWKGPIVAVFSVNEHRDCSNQVLPYYIKQSTYRKSIYGAPLKIKCRVKRADEPKYPVNRLRNIALLLSDTDLVFLVDADFIPDVYLYDKLKHFTSSRLPVIETVPEPEFGPAPDPLRPLPEAQQQSTIVMLALFKSVFVVPAFDQKLGSTVSVARDKKELIKMANNGIIIPILNDTLPQAHAHVDYKKWTSKKPATDAIYQIINETPFEPYVIGHIDVLPLYDERFLYYGDDKVLYHYQLDLMGFRYFVLADHFIIHRQHEQGAWAKQERDDKYIAVRAMAREYVRELRQKYSTAFWMKQELEWKILAEKQKRELREQQQQLSEGGGEELQ